LLLPLFLQSETEKAKPQKSIKLTKMLHCSIFFSPTFSRTSPPITNQTTIPSFCFTTPSSYHHHQQWQLKQPKKQRGQLFLALCASPTTSYEVGGGYPDEELDLQDKSGRTSRTQQQWDSKLDTSDYEALLNGGEQVTSVLQEMITLVTF
jgi:hypothetical protein